MLINEIVDEVKMTKRAIKYYEEKGLLSVNKDDNGYRNYSRDDVETLKKISLYRKLGIGINDIQKLLKNADKQILLDIYKQKLAEHNLQNSELQALKEFIEDGDIEKANELIDYDSLENAIESLVVDKYWASYIKNHFKPFLQVRIQNNKQQEALEKIMRFCGDTKIKLPLIMRLATYLTGGFKSENKTAEQLISYYRDMSDEEYEKLKETAWKGVKMKMGVMKYHPAFIAQRKIQKQLQNIGYNDIFIPNMMALSPQYNEYKQALDCINDKICLELGLYYDQNYNLHLKK